MRPTGLTKRMSMKRFKKFKIDCLFSIYSKVTWGSLIMNVFCFVFFSSSFPSSSYYLLSLAITFFNFIFHCLTIYINLIIVLLLLLLMSLLSLLLLLLLLSQLFLRKQVGESSKQGIQVAWSSPINHVK